MTFCKLLASQLLLLSQTLPRVPRKNQSHIFVNNISCHFSGLKKLLSDHPCLFKIVDDEFVYLHSNETTANVIDKRDCNEDAKEYFKHKLLSFGIGCEVPIQSLHGHRSQASHEIRHTSGKSLFTHDVISV